MSIVCVGKMREKYYSLAATEYTKRLQKYQKVTIIECEDLPEPSNSSTKIQEQIMQKEGEMILRKIKPTDTVIALCIGGKMYESQQLASFIQEKQTQGKQLVFVIGGSLGLSPAVVQRSDYQLSLSSLTRPHQLARVVLLEQLYRTQKILSGERYQK